MDADKHCLYDASTLGKGRLAKHIQRLGYRLSESKHTWFHPLHWREATVGEKEHATGRGGDRFIALTNTAFAYATLS